jgi:hypothetical protein
MMQLVEQQVPNPVITDASPIWDVEYREQIGLPAHWIRPCGSVNKFYHAVASFLAVNAFFQVCSMRCKDWRKHSQAWSEKQGSFDPACLLLNVIFGGGHQRFEPLDDSFEQFWFSFILSLLLFC